MLLGFQMWHAVSIRGLNAYERQDKAVSKKPQHSYRKQGIPSIKRAALWRAYKGERCPYCRERMNYTDMWVEHIVLERTLRDPSEWEKRKLEYGLPDEFKINDYENWIPVHSWCNLDRGKSILERKAAHHYLMIAKRHAEKAREQEVRLEKKVKADSIISELEVALEKGTLLRDDLLNFLRDRMESKPDVNEPIVLTFGVNTDDLVESGVLPEEISDLSYAEICDWLEKDFLKRLCTVLSRDYYYPEASARNGETLSVRLVFVDLDWDEFDRFDCGWWEILEIAYLSEIYPEGAG